MAVDTQEATIQKLKTVLADLPIQVDLVKVAPSNAFLVIAQIVSPNYEGMDEAERQSMVWNHIHRALDDEEQRRVEFVYTDAPSELEELVENHPTAKQDLK